MALDYDHNWVGRYYVQEATLLGVSLLPSVAYRVNERLSVGATLNAMYGMLEEKVASLADGLFADCHFPEI